MAKHNELGKQGEHIALEFLLEKGYAVLATNWRYGRAEIDIIAKDGPILVFFEVKTRSSDFMGNPEEFVTSNKESLISEAAAAYMRETNHEWEIRFDVIGIIIKEPDRYTINHIEGAFFPFL